jgi:hypothetical protein
VNIEREVEKLFRRYRRDAVLLHRPWPPHSAPKTNSKFGGLPRLPEHYEWPRTDKGVALHFMAQIDCADIDFGSQLPPRGVLFFFLCHDDSTAWRGNEAHDACHVIFARDAFALTPLRPVPADLLRSARYFRPSNIEIGCWKAKRVRISKSNGRSSRSVSTVGPIAARCRPSTMTSWRKCGASGQPICSAGYVANRPTNWKRPTKPMTNT